MESVGNKIRHLRKLKGFSQEELADEIGVTRQTISKWEKDLMSPNSDKIDNLCYVLGVTPEYLFTQNIKGYKHNEVALTKENNNESNENVNIATEHKSNKKIWILLAVTLTIFVVLCAILCAVVGCIYLTPNTGFETVKISGIYNWIFYLSLSIGLISLIILIILLIIKIKKSKCKDKLTKSK